jgi:hypothetical protein
MVRLNSCGKRERKKNDFATTVMTWENISELLSGILEAPLFIENRIAGDLNPLANQHA